MSEKDEPEKGHNDVIATIGSFKSGDATVTVTVAAWTDEKGTRYPPTVRLTRTSKAGKARAMTSLRTVEEVEGVAKLLPEAAKRLGTELGKK